MDFFTTGREMTHPYTCGKNMSEVDPNMWKQLSADTLTQEEQKSPFARHFYQPMAPIEEAHCVAIAHGPLHAAQCFMPENAGAILLQADENYPCNGYGVLQNGVGFARITIHQNGIHDEMIRKYREEFAHDETCRNLFYKIWFPKMHLIHFEDGIIENFGWGMVRQEMNWNLFRFAHIGIQEEEILHMDPHCICLLGVGGQAEDLSDPERPKWPTLMVSITREVPDGRVLQVIYWSGLKLHTDGTVTIVPNPDSKKTEREMGMMMEHCMREYCNELKLMQDFWRESSVYCTN